MGNLMHKAFLENSIFMQVGGMTFYVAQRFYKLFFANIVKVNSKFVKNYVLNEVVFRDSWFL